MSICQTTWDYRLFDSRGVAPRASRVLTLRVQPAESIVPISATGVTPAVITKRTCPPASPSVSSVTTRIAGGKMWVALIPHHDESRKGHP